MTRPRPPLEDWDLPSDADMLRWLERHGASIIPVSPNDWQVILPRAVSAGLTQNVLAGRGPTVHAALEAAIRAHP